MQCCVFLARSIYLSVALAALLGAGEPPVLPKIPIATLPEPRQEPKDKEPDKDKDAKGGNGDKKDEKNGGKDDEPAKPTETGPELTLGECIAVAMERSPDLKALRESQRATAASSQALNNIGPIGAVFAPDLPVRKAQAACGLVAAAADIKKKQNELTQDVTRLYFSVVYARQQEAVVEDVVEQLLVLLPVAEARVKAPPPNNIDPGKVSAMKIVIGDTKAFLATARHGSRKAMAGLRQVMAVREAEFPFRVKDKELPVIGAKVHLPKSEVIERALANRPEIALATAGVDAFRLEVYAQARIPCRQTVRTFASGSDIHARQFPQGSRDKDAPYRPEAMAPEMPPQLVGSKIDRVSRAMAYCVRAKAVYETTRFLIALEAEAAFLDLELTAEKLALARQKRKDGRDALDRAIDGIGSMACWLSPSRSMKSS